MSTFINRYKLLTATQKLILGLFVILIAAIGTYSLIPSHASQGSPPSSSCPSALDSHQLINGEVTTGTPPCLGGVSLGLGYTGSEFGANFYGQPLPTSAPVNPDSTTYVNEILSYLCPWPANKSCGVDRPGGSVPKDVLVNGELQTSLSTPLYVVPANQPVLPMCTTAITTNCVHGYDLTTGLNNDLNPNIAQVVNGGIPVPSDAIISTNSDATMDIYQPSTDKLWELWKVNHDIANNVWDFAWGGIMPSNLPHNAGAGVSASDGSFPDPLGTSAIGISMSGVVSRIEELQAGQIDHPLDLELPAAINMARGVVPNCPSGESPCPTASYSWPADRNDGVSPSPTAIPEGTRFKLNLTLAQINSLNLSPLAHTIAVAAMKYGFIDDNSAPGAVVVKLGNPDTYVAAGLSNPYDNLFSFPSSSGLIGFNCNYENPSIGCSSPSPYVMQNFPWSSLVALPYNYDENGNPGGGGSPGPPDDNGESITITAPTSGATASGTVSLESTATDNIAITDVQFQLDGANLGPAITTSPYNYTWDTTSVPNGTHSLTAILTDDTGNTTSQAVPITVDNVKPKPPYVQNFNFNNSSKSLTWAAYPGAAVYSISTTYSNHQVVSTNPPISGTSYTPPVLSGQTVNYTILPEVKDSHGNYVPESGAAESPAVPVNWPTVSRHTPPSVPAGLSAVAISRSQINLSWNASTSSISSVAGYKVFRVGDNQTYATVTSTTFGDTNLKASTKYSYYVEAFDAIGNVSGPSSTVSAYTKAVTSDNDSLTVIGAVVNAQTGQPLGGVLVMTGGHATPNGPAIARTNAEGEYSLTGITPNARHTYSYRLPGYQDSTLYHIFSAVRTNYTFTTPRTLKNVKLKP